MVQVYLPMGYPLQSGNQFANVIYQGGIVRLYTLAVDPRSDAQLQNRRFLSDVNKMKKCLGLWAKGSLKTVLGSSWGTVLYQIIKADVENYWSEALAEWETFAEVNQEAWRNAAPYQATFNDVGMIYFGLTRVIARTLFFYSGETWKASSTWAENESALAVAWWAKDLTDAMVKGVYDDASTKIEYSGTWYIRSPWTAYNNATHMTNVLGASLMYFFIGLSSSFTYAADPPGGTGELFLDGVSLETFTQSIYGGTKIVTAQVRKLHCVKLVYKTGYFNMDRVDVL
jgi:hypothetical protein